MTTREAWTIDIGYFYTSQWLATASCYDDVETAVAEMCRLPRSTSCIYRVRRLEIVEPRVA